MNHDAPTIRRAEPEDLAAIIALYAEDELAEPRGGGGVLEARYTRAFAEIGSDPNNGVYVAELDGAVVGTFQLTFIRQLSYAGCLVAQIESVIVHSEARSRGVGDGMMRWAIREARSRGCLRVQLTSNLRRERAHRFYERLGFVASHRGMKLYLDGSS